MTAEADRCVSFKLGQLGRIISTFQKAGVEKIVLAGAVSKPQLFSGKFRPDRKLIALLAPP